VSTLQQQRHQQPQQQQQYNDEEGFEEAKLCLESGDIDLLSDCDNDDDNSSGGGGGASGANNDESDSSSSSDSDTTQDNDNEASILLSGGGNKNRGGAGIVGGNTAATNTNRSGAGVVGGFTTTTNNNRGGASNDDSSDDDSRSSDGERSSSSDSDETQDNDSEASILLSGGGNNNRGGIQVTAARIRAMQSAPRTDGNSGNNNSSGASLLQPRPSPFLSFSNSSGATLRQPRLLSFNEKCTASKCAADFAASFFKGVTSTSVAPVHIQNIIDLPVSLPPLDGVGANPVRVRRPDLTGPALEQALALMDQGKYPGFQGQPVQGKFQRFVPPNTIQPLFTAVHVHTKWPKKGHVSREYQEVALQLYMPNTTIVASSITDLIEKIVALRFLGAFMKQHFLLTGESIYRTREADKTEKCMMNIESIKRDLAPLLSPARYEVIKRTLEEIVQRWATHNVIGYLCNICCTGERCGDRKCSGFMDALQPRRFLKIMYGKRCIDPNGKVNKKISYLYEHILQEDSFKGLFPDLPDCYSYGVRLSRKYDPSKAKWDQRMHVSNQH